MPFTETSTLPDLPDVRILFNGLLLWGPDSTDVKTCRIGVHRSAADHYLSIEVRIKKKDAQGRDLPDVILMRHLGPLSFIDGQQSNPGLLLKVNPPTGAGVTKFIPRWGTFERRPGSTSHPQDYRWRVDLDEIHGVTVSRDRNSTNPDIKITEGTLYTAMKSKEDTRIQKLNIQNATTQDFYPIAALMGININLNAGSDLVLNWSKDGVKKELHLPRSDDPSKLSYEIYIDNSPTFSDELSHSDFREYYKALDPIPSNQFDLIFPDLVGLKRLTKFSLDDDDLGTPTIACMPVGHGGS
jgi:hypothetical protein